MSSRFIPSTTMDTKEHRIARSGEPDSMRRLATEGKKVGEARREVEEEASQAQSDRANSDLQSNQQHTLCPQPELEPLTLCPETACSNS